MFVERYKHTFLPLIRHHISDVIFPTSYFRLHISISRLVISSCLYRLSYSLPTSYFRLVLSFCRSVVLSFCRSFLLNVSFLCHISDSFYRSVILSFCRSFLLNVPFLRHISGSLSVVLSVIFPTRSLLFYCSVVLFPTVPVSYLTLLTCFFYRCYCVT